jgi:hypothetical protein
MQSTPYGKQPDQGKIPQRRDLPSPNCFKYQKVLLGGNATIPVHSFRGWFRGILLAAAWRSHCTRIGNQNDSPKCGDAGINACRIEANTANGRKRGEITLKNLPRRKSFEV